MSRIPATVLVVDDVELNRELLEVVLEEAGYGVLLANDGEQALEIVQSIPPRAILLDIMMPGLDGYEVCRRLKSSRRTCFIPIVMVTALSSTLAKVRGLEAGADDFIEKPFSQPELLARLRSLLAIRELRDELDSVDRLIYTMVEALESKIPSTRGHSGKVALLARRVGEQLQLAPREIYDLVQGALLHDIGKLAVPEEVLAKEDRERSNEERMRYAAHPVQGDRILAGLESLGDARRIVREHHERLDGSGFPSGLSGPAFSLSVEIVAAANRFMGLYALDPDRAPALLRAEAEAGQFHPDLIEEIVRHGADLPAEIPPLIDLLPVPPPSSEGTILVADSDLERRSTLTEILAESGFRTHWVPDRPSAREVLEHQPVEMLLVDEQLTGAGPIGADWSIPEQMPVILLAGERTLSRLEPPIDEVLRPPIDRQELVARTRSLLRLSSHRRDLLAKEKVVYALCSALEARDPFTRGHSNRVASLAERLGRELGLDEANCNQLNTAGMVHDIGKVTMPEELLLAHRSYSADERQTLARHVEAGYELCRLLQSLEPVLPMIRHHLERFDGSGYPEGLAGGAIPLGARILGLVDAFDALTSARSYRQEHSMEEAAFLLVKELNEQRWDPEVFRAFARLMQQGGADDLYRPLR